MCRSRRRVRRRAALVQIGLTVGVGDVPAGAVFSVAETPRVNGQMEP